MAASHARSQHGAASPAGPIGDRSCRCDAPSPPRRRLDRGLLLASLVIAVGLVLVVIGIARRSPATRRPSCPTTIESVEPVPDGVQVLPQTSVFVDLDPATRRARRSTASSSRPSTSTSSTRATPSPASRSTADRHRLRARQRHAHFTPSEGAPIETFEPASTGCTVIYWQPEEGRAPRRSFTWTFNVI